MKLINRCPHIVIRGIYGDEILARGGYRLVCSNCGRLLNGPVKLATWSMSDIYIQEWKSSRE